MTAPFSPSALADQFVRMWEQAPVVYSGIVVLIGALFFIGAFLTITRATVAASLAFQGQARERQRPCLRCLGSGWWCVTCDHSGPDCVCELHGDEPEAMDCSECQGDGWQ